MSIANNLRNSNDLVFNSSFQYKGKKSTYTHVL